MVERGWVSLGRNDVDPFVKSRDAGPQSLLKNVIIDLDQAACKAKTRHLGHVGCVLHRPNSALLPHHPELLARGFHRLGRQRIAREWVFFLS